MFFYIPSRMFDSPLTFFTYTVCFQFVIIIIYPQMNGHNPKLLPPSIFSVTICSNTDIDNRICVCHIQTKKKEFKS